MASIPELKEMGQSMWLDSIDRRLLVGDGLMRLIRMGISGVTSNPTIFQQAMEASDAYDDPIRDLLQKDPYMDAEAIYEWLTVRDVQMAADQLHPVYEQSNGVDGYVSLEVSPHLAYDTEATLAAARHLWRSVNRPNLMIKVPATQEGLPAMERLIAGGGQRQCDTAVLGGALRGGGRGLSPRTGSLCDSRKRRVGSLLLLEPH